MVYTVEAFSRLEKNQNVMIFWLLTHRLYALPGHHFNNFG